MLLRVFNLNFKTATLLMSIFIVAVFVLPALALAQSADDFGINDLDSVNLGTRQLKDTIALVINIFLGFLGVIATGLIIYAGWLWMTSGGEEDKIADAKKIIRNAVIGLAIIMSSYLIARFIISRLDEATRGGEDPSGGRGSFDVNIGALGGGILRDVYPEPGARDVPRNVLLMVSFKEAMDTATIINTQNRPQECAGLPQEIICGNLKEFTLRDNSVVPSVKIINRSADNSFLAANQVIALTRNNRDFVFNPNPLLGSGDGNSDYTVNLSDQIAKVGGNRAFFSGGFNWSFQVSNLSDLTPPQVESVEPAAGANVPKNAIFQINFNEAVNLLSATGVATGNAQEPFNNILISYENEQEAVQYLAGEFMISNRFRTVEFIPVAVCEVNGQPVEQNSCGVTPKCLPGSELLAILAKAAIVNNNETLDPLSGITDAAGNSLDGNANGAAQGQPDDNYTSSFNTTDELDLTPPTVRSITPEQGSDTVPKNSRINARFSELLRSSTVNSDNYTVYKFACDGAEFPDDLTCYPEGGFNVYKQNVDRATTAVIRTYSPYLNPLTVYNPRLTAGIQDMYQNCLNPAVGPCDDGQVSPNCQ
ncbi:MAG: Ig-like domain-containing protein [Candidatus Komeilibacteria bacterium]|nr:Ig-like domain-containing protein [Candidatus Komeilibacteria bacterium]